MWAIEVESRRNVGLSLLNNYLCIYKFDASVAHDWIIKMPDDIEKYDGNSQRRLNRQKTVVKNNVEEIPTWSEQDTEIRDNGDIITTETNYRWNNKGEIISSPNEIVGQCQEPSCQTYLTMRTIRYCYFCGKVNCMVCSNWDEKESKWICKQCLKRIKRKRFFKAVGKILLLPVPKRRSSDS